MSNWNLLKMIDFAQHTTVQKVLQSYGNRVLMYSALQCIIYSTYIHACSAHETT